ncbi:MAG: hypothetical protein DCC71_05600 [Proteobacteria bacterium]|nr:MAG: hypothetical protein DCC71_05600 [Pseudomonadota bacterium]
MTTRNASHRTPPPRTVEDALERARRHGLAMLAEGAELVRSLADAASLAATGAPTESHAALTRALAWIDAAAEQARSASGRPGAAWLEAVSHALDDEIERWEERSRRDSEARSVLRAFLGVREILWEFGLRAEERGDHDAERPARAEQASAPDGPRPRAPRTARRAAARVQRVPVEG